jgi:hypothetical protein
MRYLPSSQREAITSEVVLFGNKIAPAFTVNCKKGSRIAPMMKRFSLPAVLTNLIATNGKCVAHNLDFDLVAVAPTEEEAWARLRLAVKTYVEFGLSKGWEHSMLFAAPQEVRDLLKPNTPVQIMPPLEIASDTTPVLAVRSPHETERLAG